MYTSNPGIRGATFQGKAYEVRDQIMLVDDDFVLAARSLGFITAVEANLKAAEVGATAPEPAAKVEAVQAESKPVEAKPQPQQAQAKK